MKHQFSIVFAADDTDDQFFLQTTMREIDHTVMVHAVYNGDQLVKFLENRSQQNINLPDLIITDINMPLVDGLEAIRRIKANINLAKIPIYVLTTSCEERTKSLSLELGAENCFTKPTDSFAYKKILLTILEHFKSTHPISSL